MRVSSGNSFCWETEVPLALKGDYDPNFTAEMMVTRKIQAYKKIEIKILMSQILWSSSNVLHHFFFKIVLFRFVFLRLRIFLLVWILLNAMKCLPLLRNMSRRF